MRTDEKGKTWTLEEDLEWAFRQHGLTITEERVGKEDNDMVWKIKAVPTVRLQNEEWLGIKDEAHKEKV